MSQQENKDFNQIEKEAQELLEEKDADMRIRNYDGFLSIGVVILLIGWTIFQLYFNTLGVMDAITLRAYHAMFLLLFTFLFYPAYSTEKRKRKSIPIQDVLLICLTVLVFGYLVLNYQRVAMSGGFLNQTDLIIAGIGMILVLEAGRRTSKNLAILAVVFLLFNWFGKFVSGPLGHSGFTLRRVLSHMFWGSQGIFGVGIGVSATYIFTFVLFGSFLKYSGFSQFINDIALTLVGRSPGGPAKVAVLASALLGMMNGSAIANVATTGTITIPLMKRTGYKAEFAAAVEAVASTGGQFAPPIMGAVGFVMAEFLGINYTQVMLAAFLPAFLYYLGILVSVHLEAKKLGLKGLSKENIPVALDVIKERGHLIIPLVILMGMMMLGYTPLFSAVAAIFSTLVSSWFRKETRMDLKTIIAATAEGARGAIGVGVSCVLIGLIIGTVSLTSLGLNFGYVVLEVVGEGQLFLGGFMVMIMSTILGMGVPGVAAYVIVAAVAVPVLINVGATPMAAHMFCLIYACLSNITPPVAMSSYVAAGIAKSNQTKTSLIAIKLGITGFILPFFFLNNPLLLFGSVEGVSLLLTIRTLITASVGVLCLAAGTEGMLIKECSVVTRVLLIIVGLLAIDPKLQTDILGMIILITITMIQMRRKDHALTA
ncbi:TRAP transporter permease [Clostridium formicaceticum]|uniref:C4-dicarboxylate ABC transporter permease n=1 Tax=Clostridium formicaceticum TaxID=1497 RepID=A0AAC9RNR1_9CLOT|nr:TRAP transporter fused permease subunit [Clostridium formicaceticum]AOY77908.1 C4-dicarboxylate ABC transporter permease [Clostridium formicaceticum]ARE88525.1 Sialic acid TRAP transporter permease protein SiaT [Clostridium formicaceticum]